MAPPAEPAPQPAVLSALHRLLTSLGLRGPAAWSLTWTSAPAQGQEERWRLRLSTASARPAAAFLERLQASLQGEGTRSSARLSLRIENAALCGLGTVKGLVEIAQEGERWTARSLEPPLDLGFYNVSVERWEEGRRGTLALDFAADPAGGGGRVEAASFPWESADGALAGQAETARITARWGAEGWSAALEAALGATRLRADEIGGAALAEPASATPARGLEFGSGRLKARASREGIVVESWWLESATALCRLQGELGLGGEIRRAWAALAGGAAMATLRELPESASLEPSQHPPAPGIALLLIQGSLLRPIVTEIPRSPTPSRQ
jgi:hypothetical protein